MKSSRFLLSSLTFCLLGLLGRNPLAAQSYFTPGAISPAPTQDVVSPATPVGAYASTGRLSNWITYGGNCSCHGEENGPPYIQSETILRAGPSVAVGGGIINRSVDVGWAFTGGIRSLLFNNAYDRAWVVTFSITNINYSGSDDAPFFAIRNPNNPNARLNMINRTTGDVSIGREYYLWNSADSRQKMWRAGWDVGGRYGSGYCRFEDGHNTDVIGGAFVAIHTDLEIPCGWATLVHGIRYEYNYTSTDVIQRGANIMDMMLLYSFGCRW